MVEVMISALPLFGYVSAKGVTSLTSRPELLVSTSSFFFFFLEIYVQQVVYVLRRTGSDKLPLGVIMLIESSRS